MAEFRMNSDTNQEILIQLAKYGRIDKIVEVLSKFEDIKDIEGLRKYTLVVAGNEIFVQEICN